MTLVIPNLDIITKIDPKTGEALKKIQDYTITNVTAVPGNAVASPPQTPTPPASNTTTTPTPAPAVPDPPLCTRLLLQP
jgi:hypothetical protein